MFWISTVAVRQNKRTITSNVRVTVIPTDLLHKVLLKAIREFPWNWCFKLFRIGEYFTVLFICPIIKSKLSPATTDKQWSRLMTKPTKWYVRPVKTQISLGICPVWSESSQCAQWVAEDPIFLHADSKNWSDWVDALTDPSLRWAQRSFCWFCHEAAQFTSCICTIPDHFIPWD